MTKCIALLLPVQKVPGLNIDIRGQTFWLRFLTIFLSPSGNTQIITSHDLLLSNLSVPLLLPLCSIICAVEKIPSNNPRTVSQDKITIVLNWSECCVGIFMKGVQHMYVHSLKGYHFAVSFTGRLQQGKDTGIDGATSDCTGELWRCTKNESCGGSRRSFSWEPAHTPDYWDSGIWTHA